MEVKVWWYSTLFSISTRYFKKIDNTDHISLWKSKGCSYKIIKPPTTSGNGLASEFFGNKTIEKFDESCLKKDKIRFTWRKTESYMLFMKEIFGVVDMMIIQHWKVFVWCS